MSEPEIPTPIDRPEIFRTLVSTLVSRANLANTAGISFGGKRDLYKALGYPRNLFASDYRSYYRRNAVSGRIVEAKPEATWYGEGEVFEDEDPETVTQFEAEWKKLNERLRLWATFERVDVLAGIGRYAILLLGAPGDLEVPLVSCSADDLMYVTAFSEEDARIDRFETDLANPRYGQ